MWTAKQCIFSQITTVFIVRAQETKFLKCHVKSKNKFSFILGVEKIRLDESIPNMVSELRLDNILPLFWQKQMSESQSWSILMIVPAKIWVKPYPSSIQKPYLESSRQDEPFIPPIWKKIWKLFFVFRSISKVLSLVRKPKRQFLWEKNDTVLLFTSHGTGLAPKTWKYLSSVKNETPLCALTMGVFLRTSGSAFVVKSAEHVTGIESWLTDAVTIKQCHLSKDQETINVGHCWIVDITGKIR